MAYTLPDLPYAYDALEPFIDAQTMQIHHDKHHQAYVDKLNEALKDHAELAEKPIEELLADLAALPDAVRTAVKNHGGGHYNHTLYWESLTPADQVKLPAELETELTEVFGGVEHVKTKLTEAGLGRFGSGWAWLVKTADGKLDILSTANQDTPLSDGAIPLLGIDVWEHAYYLKYQNKRADYLEAFWNVVNWAAVAKRWSAS